jgi:hypothetical protein
VPSAGFAAIAHSRFWLGQREMALTGKNRIMIYGPKDDGTYVVEFRTAEVAISIPREPKLR